MSLTPRRWTALLVPALLVVLLGLQIALGIRGFDRPHLGTLGLLEAPGTLLGWGGVLVLLVLFGWLLLGYWGRDPFGLSGPGGIGVRLVFCVVLGVATAGLLALVGGATVGGLWGARLAELLQTLGSVLAALLLLAMAAAAGMLAIAPFFSRIPAARPPTESGSVLRLEPPPGLFDGTRSRGPKPLYPVRRYDEAGNELPMEIEGRDVGPIRYRESDAPVGVAEPPPPEPTPVPPASELHPGVRFAEPEEGEEPPAEDGPPAEPSPAAPARPQRLRPGVRYADEPPPPAEAESDEPASRGRPEMPLPAGVRYRDEDAIEDPEEDARATATEPGPPGPAPSEAPSAPKGPAPPGDPVDPEAALVALADALPADAEPEEDDEARALAEADAEALALLEETAPFETAAISDEESMALYRQKLEGSGFFDEPAASVPVAPDAVAPPLGKEARPARKGKRRKTRPAEAAPASGDTKRSGPGGKAKKTRRTARAAPAETAPTKAGAKARGGTRAAATDGKARPAKAKKSRRTAGADADAPARPEAKAPAQAPAKRHAPPRSPGRDDAGREHDAAPRRKGAALPQDDLSAKAVEVAFERGAASSVLLSRKLGIGYARARALMESLVKAGVLGEMTPSGARPLLVSREEWDARG